MIGNQFLEVPLIEICQEESAAYDKREIGRVTVQVLDCQQRKCLSEHSVGQELAPAAYRTNTVADARRKVSSRPTIKTHLLYLNCN